MRVRSLCTLALLVVFAGCKEEPAPVVAAKRYASAVRARDTERLLEVVDSKTSDYVQRAAERASDQIGDRRPRPLARFGQPTEMLQVVDVNARNAIAKAELLSESGDTASVRLTGADGTEHDLQLVLEDGAWKVSLPTPPAPAGAATPSD